MFINRGTGKQIIYSNNVLLSGNKKEWTADRLYNMEEIHRHYAKQKKSYTYCMNPYLQKADQSLFGMRGMENTNCKLVHENFWR